MEFTGYYGKLIKNYDIIGRPLTNLLRNQFKWGRESEDAFVTLKKVMMHAPVLASPDFSKPFKLETDASGHGVSAILMQNRRPISYMSKNFSARNQILSIYENEFLAVVMVVQRWRHCLIGHKFTIKTHQ